MDFEAYLHSKKIDSAQFRKLEPVLWESWQKAFSQMHPASFTSQKLYLINPIRRKYHYNIEPPKPIAPTVQPVQPAQQTPLQDSPKTENEVAKPAAKPGVPRPVFKPKPKLNS